MIFLVVDNRTNCSICVRHDTTVVHLTTRSADKNCLQQVHISLISGGCIDQNSVWRWLLLAYVFRFSWLGVVMV